MSGSDPESLWSAYLEAYGPVSAEKRRSLLSKAVDDDVVFTNPDGGGETRDGLIAHIEDFQAKLPGTTFSTERFLSSRNGYLAIWGMEKEGAKVATGYNYLQVADDGRFKVMAGFF